MPAAAGAAAAVVGTDAGIAQLALPRARSTAVGRRFAAILDAVRAACQSAGVRRHQTDLARAITVLFAGLTVRASCARPAPAIGVGLGIVQYAVGAARQLTEALRALGVAAVAVAGAMLSGSAAWTTAEATAIHVGLVLIDDAVETRVRSAGSSETQREVTIAVVSAFQPLGARTAASAAVDVGLALIPEPVRTSESSALVAASASSAHTHTRTRGACARTTGAQRTATRGSTGADVTSRGNRTWFASLERAAASDCK